jgi:tRNA (guanine26-N2/guanine27-N2)-dimethyltransferase
MLRRAPGFVLPKLALTREGSADLYVPEDSLRAKDPKTFPAFFNPAARVNRDVSVAVAMATKPATFLDALAGIGARGVRVAKEASKSMEVTLVEFNETSLAIARKNAKRNRVEARCDLVHEESNAYLHSRFGRLERFDAVDVDPFGTPAPYMQGALTAANDGAVVSITATDTATLCGVYPSVALRRYGAHVVKSEFAHEAAVRVLFGFCARVGGVVDTGIEPMLAHSTLHYLRVYFRVARGAAKSDRCLKQLGFVASCGTCHEVSVTTSYSRECPRCGGKAACIGPQWIGKLVGEGVASEAAKASSSLGWRGAAEALTALEGSNAYPPYGYSMEGVTSRERMSSVPFQKVVDSLKASGRLAMRQPFGSSGLKTDASYQEVLAAVRGSAPP